MQKYGLFPDLANEFGYLLICWSKIPAATATFKDSAAPFDGIILAAAGLGIPDALLDQLAIGGRLVAPVAKNEKEQQLVMVERMSSQRYQRTVLEEVFFVPLQSGTV